MNRTALIYTAIVPFAAAVLMLLMLKGAHTGGGVAALVGLVAFVGISVGVVKGATKLNERMS